MLSPTAARQCWRGTPACRHGPHILAPRSTNLQGSPSYIGPQLVGRLWTPVTLACPRLSRTLSRCQAATVGAAAVAQEPEVLSCTQYLGDASIWVIVSKGDGDYQVEVIADQPRPNLVLHWAVDGWELPPEQAWPPGTRKVGDGGAVQSPFEFGQLVTLTFPEAMCPSRLVFVLRDGDQWIHNRGGDFSADLKPSSIEEVVLYTAPPPPALPQPELLAHTRYDAGVSVVVDRNNGVYQLEVAADKPRKGLVLHWAIEDWQLPPQAAWPPGTTKAGEGAVQTPFQRGEYVTLTFPESVCPSKVVFVLKDGSKWVKNHGQDFSAALKPPTPESQGLEVLSYTHHEAGLSTVVGKGSGSYLVEVVADHPRPELVMHWAVEDWRLPARGVWPPGTVQAGDGAVQTPFQGGQSIKLLFPQDTCPSKLVFVLKEGEQWLNDNGADFTARLTPGSHTADPPPAHNQQHHHNNNNNQHYAALEEEPEVISCTNFEAGILVVVGRVEGAFMVVVMSDQPRQDMVLHWAVEDWQLPQKKVWPPNSTQAGDAAVQTPFREGSQSVAIAFPESLCPSKVVFVLKEGDRWITDGGKDFSADLRPALSQGNHAHEALSNGHLDAGFWGGSNGNGAGRHANGANGNGRHYSNWAAQVAH